MQGDKDLDSDSEAQPEENTGTSDSDASQATPESENLDQEEVSNTTDLPVAATQPANTMAAQSVLDPKAQSDIGPSPVKAQVKILRITLYVLTPILLFFSVLVITSPEPFVEELVGPNYTAEDVTGMRFIGLLIFSGSFFMAYAIHFVRKGASEGIKKASWLSIAGGLLILVVSWSSILGMVVAINIFLSAAIILALYRKKPAS